MNLRTITFIFLAGLMASVCQQVAAATAPKTMTDEQKAIYAFGASIGRQVSQQTKQIRLSPEEIEIFKSGFSDSLADKKLAVDPQQYTEQFKNLVKTRLDATAAEAKKQGEAFLAKAAQEPGAVKTPSGLVFKTIKPGTGAQPKSTDTVRVNYEGTFPDGKVFDSSAKTGQPAEFMLKGVIPCWTEGMQRMHVGEKAQLVCPSSLAYGDRGAGTDIPPGATLKFEVELLDIKQPAAPPAAAPAKPKQ